MKTDRCLTLATRFVYPGLFVILLCLCCQVAPAQKKEKAAKTAGHVFTYKIIEGNHSTYGYDVFADGKLLVHQPSVPALPGNDGFATRAAAEKVAKLVIQKIEKGEMPPTITLEELKKLKAI